MHTMKALKQANHSACVLTVLSSIWQNITQIDIARVFDWAVLSFALCCQQRYENCPVLSA